MRRKVALPKYHTYRSGGEDHQPEFISEVNVFGNEYTSETRHSKIDAEQNAANIALRQLFPDVTVRIIDYELNRINLQTNDVVVLRASIPVSLDVLESGCKIIHLSSDDRISVLLKIMNLCHLYLDENRSEITIVSSDPHAAEIQSLIPEATGKYVNLIV